MAGTTGDRDAQGKKRGGSLIFSFLSVVFAQLYSAAVWIGMFLHFSIVSTLQTVFSYFQTMYPLLGDLLHVGVLLHCR